MLRKLGRKGDAFEQPHSLFYIIFTSIMIIFSIVIISVLASNMKVTPEYNMFNLRYNAMISRLLYTKECFATDTTYSSALGTTHYVQSAIVDMVKVNNDVQKSCLRGITEGKNYNFAIAKLSYSGNTTALTYVNGNVNSCLIANWERVGTYFVTINEGGTYSQGVLKFCMNNI